MHTCLPNMSSFNVDCLRSCWHRWTRFFLLENQLIVKSFFGCRCNYVSDTAETTKLCLFCHATCPHTTVDLSVTSYTLRYVWQCCSSTFSLSMCASSPLGLVHRSDNFPWSYVFHTSCHLKQRSSAGLLYFTRLVRLLISTSVT